MARIIVDLPTAEHRKLKDLTALLGLSIQEFVGTCVENALYSTNVPNKATQRAMKEIKSGKNLTVCESVDALMKKLEN
jgi:hypothetical protein